VGEEEEAVELGLAKSRCHHCGKPCQSLEELGDHLKVDHAKSEDLLCPYCNREDMLTYGNLRRHVKQSHGVILLDQGTRFGKLGIRKPLSVSKDLKQGILWELKCVCGRVSRAWEVDLKRGKKTVCGRCADAKSPEAPKARAGKFPNFPEDGPADEQDLAILERASAAQPPRAKNERLRSITVTLAAPDQRAAKPPATKPSMLRQPEETLLSRRHRPRRRRSRPTKNFVMIRQPKERASLWRSTMPFSAGNAEYPEQAPALEASTNGIAILERPLAAKPPTSKIRLHFQMEMGWWCCPCPAVVPKR
jgi:hypothetical protein